MEKTIIKDFTRGPIMKQLLCFSLPFMLSNILQQVYTLTDMVVVGQFVGSAGLTATANGSEMMMLLLFACTGFTSAGQIIVSQLIGAGARDKLNSAIGTMFSFMASLSVITLGAALAFSDALLRILNVPDEAFAEAHNYAYMCCWGIMPVFGYNAISAVLRGMGDSKHPTVFVIISSAVNIVLDLLFVGGMDMGCFGAALATVISQWVSFLCALIFAYRSREAFGFDFKWKSFAIDKIQLATLVKLGTPMALTGCSIHISAFFVNSMLNVYGVTVAAVTAVGNKITGVVTICTNALNTAGSSMVGQNFAAGKFGRVSRVLLCVLLIGLVFTSLLSVLILFYPEQIFGLFDNSPEVLAMSHEYIPIALVALSSFATRATTHALLHGVAHSTLTFVGGILDGFVARIGLSWLLGTALEMGIFGFWMGSALAGHVFTVIGLFYYVSGTWKKRKAIVA